MKMSRTNPNHLNNLDIPSGATRGRSTLKTSRRIPRILNRSRNQADKLVLFHCPHCEFNSDSQMKIGDHVMLNHLDQHIERNAQPLDLIECNLCFEQVTSVKMLERHVRLVHPDVQIM